MKNKLLIGLALFLQSNCTGTVNPTPNILLINIDDLGWADVGFNGSTFYETPHLDSLAGEGMIFTQAYATASNCAPSRACIMSGMWSPRHGVFTVGSPARGKSKDRKLIPVPNNTVLADSIVTLAEALKSGGYVTCHAGKWHLGDDPGTQGFDFNIGGNAAGHPASYYPPYKNVPLEPNHDNQYLTNRIMDGVISFLEDHHQSRFFLYYAPYAVHTPLHPKMDLLEKYNTKPASAGQDNFKYATMVENVDTQVGRLFSKMKELDLMDHTLIIFTSDNGGVYRISKQWPLRAGKGSYYEGGIREPMFVYWKDKIKPGSSCTTPVSNLDFFPTLLDIAHQEETDQKHLDGISLLPLFNHETIPERALYWHFPFYLENGNKETQDQVFRTRPGSAIRKGDWKLIWYFENNDLELYNLREDPSETNNQATTNPAKAKEMLTQLKAWQEQTEAPIPTRINPDWQ